MNTPASEPCGVHCIRTQHSMKTEQVLICLVSLSDYLFHLPIEGYTHCLHLFFSPDRKSLSFHFPLKPRKFPHVLEPGNPSPPRPGCTNQVQRGLRYSYLSKACHHPSVQAGLHCGSEGRNYQVAVLLSCSYSIILRKNSKALAHWSFCVL